MNAGGAFGDAVWTFIFAVVFIGGLALAFGPPGVVIGAGAYGLYTQLPGWVAREIKKSKP